MAIFEGSRYQYATLFHTDNESYFGKRKLLNVNLEGSVLHTVIQGDTLPSIAVKYYNKPQYWWVILDVNKATVAGVFNALKPGTRLIIPSWENLIQAVPE